MPRRPRRPPQAAASAAPPEPAAAAGPPPPPTAILATAALAGALYARSAFQSVAGGDSGELVAEACHLGVAHPPGYPLFTLLTHAAMQLHPARPAYAANLLSCAFGAAAALFVGLATREGLRAEQPAWADPAGALAAALFAFSPLVWEYSVGAEVFAMNNAFAAALLLLALRVWRTGALRDLCAAALVSGLALSNQHTVVLFVAPLGLAALWRVRPSASGTVLAGLCGLAGLAPYAYLVWAGAEPHRGSWGDTGSARGLLRHFLREEYGTLKLSPMRAESEGLAERLAIWAAHSLWEFRVAGMALALVGLLRRYRTVLTGAFVVYMLVFHALANLPLSAPMPFAVHARFWMQPHAVVAVWAGWGAAFVAPKLGRPAGLAACVALAAAGPVLSFDALDRSDAAGGGAVAAFGEAVLAALPAGALVVSHTDLNWNALRYLQQCEGRRPDVTHLNFQLMPFPWFPRQHALYPDVVFPDILPGVSTNRADRGNAELVLRFLDANVDRFPATYIDLHAINDRELGNGGVYHGRFRLVPEGLLWRALRVGGGDAPQFSAAALDEARARIRPLPPVQRFPPGSWEFVVASVFWDGHYQAGLALLSSAIDMPLAPETLPQYLELLRRAAALLDEVHLAARDNGGALTSSKADALKNAALAYLRLGPVLRVAANAGLPAPDRERVLVVGRERIEEFLREQPGDADAGAFGGVLSSWG